MKNENPNPRTRKIYLKEGSPPQSQRGTTRTLDTCWLDPEFAIPFPLPFVFSFFPLSFYSFLYYYWGKNTLISMPNVQSAKNFWGLFWTLLAFALFVLYQPGTSTNLECSLPCKSKCIFNTIIVTKRDQLLKWRCLPLYQQCTVLLYILCMSLLNNCYISLHFIMSEHFHLIINSLWSSKADQLPSKCVLFSLFKVTNYLQCMQEKFLEELMILNSNVKLKNWKLAFVTSQTSSTNLPLDDAQTVTAESMTCQSMLKITVTLQILLLSIFWIKQLLSLSS